jgi:type I restriction enzyme S subunit
MPNNWKTYKLKEVCEKIFSGGTPSTSNPEYWNGEIPWLSSGETGNRYICGTEKFITEIGLQKSSAKMALKDDIVIASAGQGKTRGQTSFLKIDTSINQSVLCFRADKEIIDSKFLFFNLSNRYDEFRNISDSFSTRGSLTKDLIENQIKLELPSLEEQKSIASILSPIDDKIENNFAINKTLEEMAMALYKHWFVDFGPFQDGEFVESELGRIPKGWEVKRLDDLIDVLSKGTTPRMKDVEGLDRKIPFLKVKDINSDGEININGLELIPEEIHLKDLKRSILLENDLLFSIAGTIGRVSIVTETLNNSNCNQALAFIRLKEKEIYKAIVYYWLKSYEVQNRIQNSVVQGVQANVSLTVLKELEFIKPSDNVLNEFSIKVNPIFELVLKNQKENQTLTQLRDTLLPKLISGEVRLKEFRE